MTTVLETWMAEEVQLMATLAAGPGEGVATREQISGKTGLEIMQAMLLTCAFEGASHGESNYSNAR